MAKLDSENFNYLKNKIVQMAWHSFSDKSLRKEAISDLRTSLNENLAGGYLTQTQYDKLTKMMDKYL